MQQGIIKVGMRTALAFTLLLALAAVFGAILFAVQRFLGMPVESWENAVFIYLVVAVGLGLLSFWIRPSDRVGPAVRLHVPRPTDIEAKDNVAALSRVVDLPYEIGDGMVLKLNDVDLAGSAIFARVVNVERSIYSDGDEWMVATLALHDPKEFELLGKSEFWELTPTSN
jgi:hypothetical protein